MSNYFGYKPEDNQKRKENNTDVIDSLGKNSNVKSYHGTINCSNSNYIANKRVDEYKRKLKDSVKVYTPEEIKKFAEERKEDTKEDKKQGRQSY